METKDSENDINFDKDIDLLLQAGDAFLLRLPSSKPQRRGLQLSQLDAHAEDRELVVGQLRELGDELRNTRLDQLKTLTVDAWVLASSVRSPSVTYYDFNPTREKLTFRISDILMRLPAWLAERLVITTGGVRPFRLPRWLYTLAKRVHEMPQQWRRARFLGLPPVVKQQFLERDCHGDGVGIPAWIREGYFRQRKTYSQAKTPSMTSVRQHASPSSAQATAPAENCITLAFHEVSMLMQALTAAKMMASSAASEAHAQPMLQEKLVLLQDHLEQSIKTFTYNDQILRLTGPFGV